jgi:hypothetical protein
MGRHTLFDFAARRAISSGTGPEDCPYITNWPPMPRLASEASKLSLPTPS